MSDRPADGAPSPHEVAHMESTVAGSMPLGLRECRALLSAHRTAATERDAYREALQEINEYARTSYAEGAMRVPAYNGFRDFQWIVNRARRALSPGAATTESEGTHG